MRRAADAPGNAPLIAVDDPRRPSFGRRLLSVVKYTLIAVGALGVFLVVVGVIVAYQDQKDTTKSSSVGDSFNADFGYHIAKESLPLPEDLPGTGWKTTSTDDFQKDEGFAGAAGVCLATQQRFDESDGLLAAHRSGRANVEISKPAPTPDGSTTSLEVDVSVYRKSDDLQQALDIIETALSSRDIRSCLEFSLTGGRVADVSPSVSAPGGGAAAAYMITLTVDGKTLQSRIELYAWKVSNVVVRVSVSGEPGEITPSLVATLIAKTESRLNRQANHPPTSTPTGTSQPSPTPNR